MTYDLVIRNGTVVDGSGLASYRADVAVVGNTIAKVGRIREPGRQEIDAEGLVVSPGFIDGHTHMDAQLFWDREGSCSCWHGVTTVVMGNCGFTLAPARPNEHELVVRNLVKAEDISAETMAAGIEWSWDSFPSFMDAVERLPHGINYAAQVGHSALRTWAMGERAFSELATEEDLQAMEKELRRSIAAGAVGFTTSRARHVVPDGRPVASRVGDLAELERLVTTAGDAGVGLFEISLNITTFDDDDADWLRGLALKTGVPITFGIVASPPHPDGWRKQLDLLDSTAEMGGRMFGQVHCRDICLLYSFLTRMPYDELPVWREMRALPLESQRERLRDAEFRAKLIAEAKTSAYSIVERTPVYDQFYAVDAAMPGANLSIAEIAAHRQVDPVEAIIQLALETDFEQLYLHPVANRALDDTLAMMRHPRTVMTFSDSGAHVQEICDSSIQTILLAYWVRERQAFSLEEAVRMITLAPAVAWGFTDRGLVREGMVADLNVFDPALIAPEVPTLTRDLPGGAIRLTQKAVGIRATIVSGQVVIDRGEHTGALPGTLLRAS